jgi:23S rRNA U2552 (ribose-2'-O)-methylase RlmE/FtsJ
MEKALSLSERGNLPPLYVDVPSYQRLHEKQRLFDSPDFARWRNLANPFEKVSRSIFIDRAGLKLANIDALYRLSGHVHSYAKYYSNHPFTYCDLAGAPGAFTQYMQFRLPLSEGYGISIRSPKSFLNWRTDALNLDRFHISNGDDGTGNLFTNWQHFPSWVKSKEGDGVDLAMADGSVDIADERADSYRQEYLNSGLLLVEALTALLVCREGGNFLLKVFDTVTEFSAQLLCLLSCCFERICLFKPVTSRPANAERYLICWGRRGEGAIAPYLQVLTQAAHRITPSTYLATLYSQPMPAEFIAWLRGENDRYLRFRAEATAAIVEHRTPPPIDIQKVPIVFNLPDKPEPIVGSERRRTPR